MAKEVPSAAFRNAPPMPSTTEMAAFVARAATPTPGPQLAIVPNEPPPPAVHTPEPPPPERAGEATVTAKAVTIMVPVSPANGDASWRSKTVRRVDGRELRKQTFYLDAGISHRLALHCAKYHYEQSKAVERAVQALLDACGD